MEYTFPELTPEENADIREARALGWAVFYPAFPNARAQAEKTLRGARDFLDKHRPEPLTPDEAQRAYDEAPAVPLSEERIKEIVDYATDPTGRVPEEPLHFTEDDVKRASGD